MSLPDPWWQSASLRPGPGGLCLDGLPLADLARERGTPLFVYSGPTLRRQVRTLEAALHGVGVQPRIFYAMKANRSPLVLGVLRGLPRLGLDLCSPAEVDWALGHGFPVEALSFNAGMLSDTDLDRLAASGVRCTLDSFSSLRRYGQRVPGGTSVHLRFDPAVAVGYQARQHLAYGRSKFGFEPEALPEVLAAARAAGLVVEGIHGHLGWGLQEAHAEEVERAFANLAALAREIPGLRQVNVGGGLGARFRADERPLSPRRWAEAIGRQLGPLGLPVACEPGTFVAAEAGVLLVTVNTVERRRGRTWVGVDAGHAINPCPALYGIPIEVLDAERPLDPPEGEYAVVGHINEAGDVWSTAAPLPPPREGSVLALLPAGAYTTSMASRHCLRGDFQEALIDPETVGPGSAA